MKINIWILFLLATIACFLAVVFFTLPSFSNHFNLAQSSKANIGTTIGGITAPIVGLFTSVLLIIAMQKQSEANKEQRLKNEFDMIFLLLNQMENEIGSFYYTQEHFDGTTGIKTGTINYKGSEGLSNFALGIKAMGRFPHDYSFTESCNR